MLSTLHTDDLIDKSTNLALKPEVITDYNLTKGEIDVVDGMNGEYSLTRVSNRWSFTVFCTLPNISTINSQIIYRNNTNVIMARRLYIRELSKQLSMPHFH